MSSKATPDANASPPSPFPYLELEPVEAAQADDETTETAQSSRLVPEVPEQEIAERCAQADRAGYERGKQEASQAAKNTLEDALAKQRTRIDEALRQFESEKQTYFQQIEAEVIQLSLAIARKVLGQQAASDPLLLAGTVRAALDRLGRTSRLTITVHPATAAKWREALSEYEHLEFAEDDRLSPEECHLNSQVGTTEISLQQQIQEVEHSFFELLAQRPASGERVQ